jgi:hypothetical protein
MADEMIREYQCEKCGRRFRTKNWALSGRIVCWQTADGQCETHPDRAQTRPVSISQVIGQLSQEKSP